MAVRPSRGGMSAAVHAATAARYAAAGGAGDDHQCLRGSCPPPPSPCTPPPLPRVAHELLDRLTRVDHFEVVRLHLLDVVEDAIGPTRVVHALEVEETAARA